MFSFVCTCYDEMESADPNWSWWPVRDGVEDVSSSEGGGNVVTDAAAYGWGKTQRASTTTCLRLKGILQRAINSRPTYMTIIRMFYSAFQGKVRLHHRTFENPSEPYIYGCGVYTLEPVDEDLWTFQNDLVTTFDWSSIEISQPVCCLRLWYLS